MPTLTLRTVGMSYMVERIRPSGLDAEALHDALVDSYGPAVAILSSPSQDDEPEGFASPEFDALIIDRKAATWDALRDWLLAWVEEQGSRYASWADDTFSKGTTATLHFHR